MAAERLAYDTQRRKAGWKRVEKTKEEEAREYRKKQGYKRR